MDIELDYVFRWGISLHFQIARDLMIKTNNIFPVGLKEHELVELI